VTRPEAVDGATGIEPARPVWKIMSARARWQVAQVRLRGRWPHAASVTPKNEPCNGMRRSEVLGLRWLLMEIVGHSSPGNDHERVRSRDAQ
jgi:hypothetical protein